MVVPEAVCAGVNDPQAALGAQLQVTPLFAESLETVATTFAVVLVCMDAGGVVASTTEIGRGLPPLLLYALPQPVTTMATDSSAKNLVFRPVALISSRRACARSRPLKRERTDRNPLRASSNVLIGTASQVACARNRACKKRLSPALDVCSTYLCERAAARA